jgi:nucleoside 2-deoxyribosyltransferase
MSNCEIAKQAANLIKGRFPNLDMYVPANAEAFVYQTYSRGLLTDTQILDIDCHILSGCDGVIAYDFDTSKGVEVEVKYAIDHGIPVFRFKEINQESINGIGDFIRSIGTPLNIQ